MEYLFAVLNRNHAPVRKAVTVEAAINLVNDRRVEIAAPQKIRVQRVTGAGIDRTVGSNQRLPEHLATEYLWAADVATRAAEQIDLERLEIEERQHVGQALIHQRHVTRIRAAQLS